MIFPLRGETGGSKCRMEQVNWYNFVLKDQIKIAIRFPNFHRSFFFFLGVGGYESISNLKHRHYYFFLCRIG